MGALQVLRRILVWLTIPPILTNFHNCCFQLNPISTNVDQNMNEFMDDPANHIVS
jgi:hypothetical protein